MYRRSVLPGARSPRARLQAPPSLALSPRLPQRISSSFSPTEDSGDPLAQRLRSGRLLDRCRQPVGVDLSEGGVVAYECGAQILVAERSPLGEESPMVERDLRVTDPEGHHQLVVEVRDRQQ